jgi:threonine dehydratase
VIKLSHYKTICKDILTVSDEEIIAAMKLVYEE